MVEKMDKPILHVHGWINGQIAIGIAGSYSSMFRRACLSGPLQDQDPDWDLLFDIGLRIQNNNKTQISHN